MQVQSPLPHLKTHRSLAYAVTIFVASLASSNAYAQAMPWESPLKKMLGSSAEQRRAFLAVIRYRGPDLDSSAEGERVIKAAHINNILVLS